MLYSDREKKLCMKIKYMPRNKIHDDKQRNNKDECKVHLV